MNGAIFSKTARDLRGQTLGWSCGLFAVGIFLVAMFPSVQRMPIADVLQSLPAPLRAVVGDPSAMLSLEGFLRIKVFDSLPLLLGVFAVAQGTAMIVGEEEAGTLELLLAQPVSRTRVAVEKLLAAQSAVIVMCAALGAGLAAGSWGTDADASAGRLFAAALIAALPTAVILAVAFLCSSTLHRTRHAATTAAAFALVSFIVHALAPVSPFLSRIGHVSVFYHYGRAQIAGGTMHAGAAALLAAASVFVAAAGVLALKRKALRSR